LQLVLHREAAIREYLVILTHRNLETCKITYKEIPRNPSDFVDIDDDRTKDLATKNLQIVKEINNYHTTKLK